MNRAIHPDDVDDVFRAIRPDDVEDVFRGGRRAIAARSSWDYEYRLVQPDGAIGWVAGRAVPLIDDDGECIGYLSSGQDVTERHTAEKLLRESESNLRSVAEVIRTLRASDDARASLCEAARRLSTAAVAWLLEPDGEALTVTAATDERLVGRVVGPGEPSAAATAMETGERLLIDDVALRPDLSARLGELGLHGCVFEPVVASGRVTGVLSVGWALPLATVAMSEILVVGLLATEAAAVIERSDLVEQLARLARHDALTGLENRRVWDEELEREIRIAERTERPLSIAVIDLDHFKRFNDTQGHQAGDDLLASTAHAWARELRRGDRLVRYGGEEFAMLLPGSEFAMATAIANRFRELVTGGQTCSVGIAQWRAGEDPEEFFARADVALFRAKHTGRNRVALATA